MTDFEIVREALTGWDDPTEEEANLAALARLRARLEAAERVAEAATAWMDGDHGSPEDDAAYVRFCEALRPYPRAAKEASHDR